ncbi:hypothetical protein [Streptomyces koyangensis]|uniref:Hydrogenase expression protein HypF n=1 Tax=Streptomyces koyangensis TaxID=188770 RepID=A0ABX7EIM1_9ACTN|nr:hypothetical protein [Streptomyces koyangensis]QRF04676.1 hypothetical protein G9U55_22545 [Streptomyces koyangensis]
MRGDEAQLAAEEGGKALGRTGPRHAAPRKSLLTKLQIPAGKAFALAAMPTAVFVGMGLTPKLALADDKADVPRGGPCVTRSDEPSESAEPDATPTPEPGASKPASPGATPTPSASPSAPSGGGSEKPEPDPADEQPTAEPEPEKTKNPLDPLGLGDALKDLFTPGDEKSEEPEPEPSASEKAGGTSGGTTEKDDKGTADSGAADKKASDEKAADEKAADKKEAAEKKAADEAKAKEEAAEKEAALSPAEQLKKDIEEAARKNGVSVSELAAGAQGAVGAADDDPCAPDPKALADLDLEPGIPLLPDDPWRLESSKLTLGGLDYHGVVKVKTYSGKVKPVLKFTAKTTDIKDLHQLTVGPKGQTGHVKAAEGSTSTIRNGEVTMYTEELKGNLFGLIPITFNPESPPPLNVPWAFFTKVKVVQAGQFGGTLTVPGLQNYFTDGD